MRFLALALFCLFLGSGCGDVDCCKYCDPDASKPCGDSCISKDNNCNKGSGCACRGPRPE